MIYFRILTEKTIKVVNQLTIEIIRFYYTQNKIEFDQEINKTDKVSSSQY